jgi:hypothetical protein
MLHVLPLGQSDHHDAIQCLPDVSTNPKYLRPGSYPCVRFVETVLHLQRRVTRPASVPTRTLAQTHGSSGAPTGSSRPQVGGCCVAVFAHDMPVL